RRGHDLRACAHDEAHLPAGRPVHPEPVLGLVAEDRLVDQLVRVLQPATRSARGPARGTRSDECRLREGGRRRRVARPRDRLADAPLLSVPQPPGNGQVGVELWIGKDDALLHRIDLVGPLTTYEPKSIVRSIRLSRFDEPVTIEPPAKA